MSKKRHNLESKEIIVKYVLEENHSIWEAADFFGVAYQTIRMWVKHYEKEGKSGLCIKNKTYSGEFKIFVVEYMRKYKLSLVETAIHFSLPDHTRVRVWKRKLNALIQEKEKSKKEIK